MNMNVSGAPPSKRAKVKDDSNSDRLLLLEADVEKTQKSKIEHQSLVSPKLKTQDILIDDIVHVLLKEGKRALEQSKSIKEILFPSKVEIEFRLGTLVSDSSFHQGIKKSDFEALLRIFRGDSSFLEEYVEESDYFFDKLGGGSIRVSYDEKMKTCKRAQCKDRLIHLNYPLKSVIGYDMRLSISIETKCFLPEILEDNWNLRRVKRRWSYWNFNHSYRVDLTQVTSFDSKDNPVSATIFEIEFEFSDESVKLCEHNEREPLRSIVSSLVKQLAFTFDQVSKMQNWNYFPQLLLEKVDSEKAAELRSICYRMVTGKECTEETPLDFPGSMPVNLSRRHIATIQSKPYFVSEKTDGIRYMLFVKKSEGVFLIDRKFDFHFVSGFSSLEDAYADVGPTLLDGEMIRCIRTQGPMFLIFDCVMFNGVSVVNETLSRRLEKIRLAVKRYRMQVVSKDETSNLPFEIGGKPIMPKDSFEDLEGHIKLDKQGEHIFEDHARHHRTDGFIFAPDERYHPKTCPNLLKWKYPEKMSIDFKVCFRDNGTALYFTCLGPHGMDIEYQASLSEEDMRRLKLDIERQPDKGQLIVEMSHNHLRGEWRYLLLRNDKNRANFVGIVFDTLEVLSENISLNELLYRISSTTETDDWETRVQEASNAIRKLSKQKKNK